MSPHWPGQINKMTTNLIKHKDTDDDRVLSAKEFGAPKDVFAKIDRNGDGQADRKELNAAHPRARVNRMTTNLINNQDTDGDRVLNIEELGVAEDVFAKIDLNGDGQADRKELNAAHPRARTNHMTTNLINNKDTDGDGLLNAEELGVAEDVFSKIDLNGDGQADRKELNAARQIARIYEGMGALQPCGDEKNENIDQENENIDVDV